MTLQRHKHTRACRSYGLILLCTHTYNMECRLRDMARHVFHLHTTSPFDPLILLFSPHLFLPKSAPLPDCTSSPQHPIKRLTQFRNTLALYPILCPSSLCSPQSTRCSSADWSWWASHLAEALQGWAWPGWPFPESWTCLPACCYSQGSSGLVQMGLGQAAGSWDRVLFGLPHLPCPTLLCRWAGQLLHTT